MADSSNPDELWELMLAFRPGMGELPQLPLRALVAYAARSARRVQRFYTLPDDHSNKQENTGALERAIGIAEEFAKGIPVTSDATFRAEHSALRFMADAKAFGHDTHSAACAAWAAVKAVQWALS